MLPKKSILVCIRNKVPKVPKDHGRIAIFSEWDALVLPYSTAFCREKVSGPSKPVDIDAGEHLLLLGHTTHLTHQTNYLTDQKITTYWYYLKFLRLKTGRFVWFEVSAIYGLPIFEKARRGMLEYAKKNGIKDSGCLQTIS